MSVVAVKEREAEKRNKCILAMIDILYVGADENVVELHSDLLERVIACDVRERHLAVDFVASATNIGRYI